MKRRIIFLDIDGVVNTLMIYKRPIGHKRGRICREGYYYDLCSPSDKRVSNIMAVILLDKLCKETKADIVISSTWRRAHYKETKKALYKCGLNKKVNIIGCTPINDSLHRGGEIEIWFAANNIKPEEIDFCILDDDSDMQGINYNFLPHLIKCDSNVGFGWNEYSKAYDMLTGKDEI